MTSITENTEISRSPLKSSYAEAALNHIKKLTQENGSDPDSIILQGCEEEIVDFEAKTTITLISKITDKIMPGRLSGMIEVMSESAAQNAAQKEYAAALLNINTVQAIQHTFLSREDKGFAIHTDAISLPFLKKDYVIYKPCLTCQKTGSVKCLPCGGRKSEQCTRCNGSGMKHCTHCNGAQMIVGGNGQKIQCPICHGQGRVSCSSCQQTGKIQCRTCRGHGVTTCPNCQGNVWNSHIYTLNFEVHPLFSYPSNDLPVDVVKIIEQYGAKISKHITLEITPSTTTSENSNIEILYKASIPYARIHYEVKKQKHTAFLFGINGRIMETTYFLDDLLRDTFDSLQNAANGQGNIGKQLEHLTRYKILADALLMAGSETQQKTFSNLKNMYRLGLSDPVIKKITTQSHQALNNITKKPKLIGLGLASILHVGLLSIYFASPLRTLLLSNISNENLHALLDAVVLFPSGYIGSVIIQITTQKALQRHLAQIMPKGLRRKSSVKIGYYAYINAVIALVVGLTIMKISGAL